MRNFLLLFIFAPAILFGQSVALTPTVTPSGFNPNEAITVTYNVTGTSLASLSSAYIWVWIPGKNIDAKYNINPASNNTTQTNNAKFTKNVNGSTTTFTITFVPEDFFSQPICLETQLGMLIKGNDWSNGQSTDHIATMTPLTNCFVVELTDPVRDPVFQNPGTNLNVAAKSSETATFTLSVDGVPVDQQPSTTTYSYAYPIPQSSGLYPVQLVVANASNDTTINFSYLVTGPSNEVARPSGVKPGINYHDGDPTKVTLCLLAPDKTYVFLRGDFNNWEYDPAYQMNRDGEYFWLELSGLTSGVEYAYQYLIDNGVVIADPFCDKVLDGNNDQYIQESIYPNLKAFPEKARSSTYEFNFASVFQTNQEPYAWQVTDFVKPDKEKLVIYELLIRDFFAEGEQHYQNLIDTIGYFKRLGITAIELMPVTEFSGNISWGYNPNFMFAPDKAYGTKNDLKAFVDACHQNGIAVIMDMVMNQQDKPNPYLMMDFDFVQNRPNATNKWFNVTAPHPFSVFYDMNHESLYTKAYLDTITYYWINEFKIDGYRFDLSKGFTQKSSNDDGVFRLFDAARVAILERMADKIWAHTPDAYVILEHFAENSEEKELAQYRSAEGKGMMLWGGYAAHNAYLQSAMGYGADSDFSSVYFGTRGWSTRHVVGYMESHDEQRMMYKNENFGAASGSYTVRDEGVGLERVKAASTIFYTVPGPKMLWQFGELGYDYPINYCPNGTESDACRTDPKPVRWDYRDEPARYRVYQHVADLLRLRNQYPVFTEGTATMPTGTALVKQLTLKNNPYNASPATADEMNAVVVVNFELSSRNVNVQFPHDGTWYDYYAGGVEVTATGGVSAVTMAPGAYKIYTDVAISRGYVLSSEDEKAIKVDLFPNPASSELSVQGVEVLQLSLVSVSGAVLQPQRTSSTTWNVSGINRGLYVVHARTYDGKTIRRKLIIE